VSDNIASTIATCPAPFDPPAQHIIAPNFGVLPTEQPNPGALS